MACLSFELQKCNEKHMSIGILCRYLKMNKVVNLNMPPKCIKSDMHCEC